MPSLDTVGQALPSEGLLGVTRSISHYDLRIPPSHPNQPLRPSTCSSLLSQHIALTADDWTSGYDIVGCRAVQGKRCCSAGGGVDQSCQRRGEEQCLVGYLASVMRPSIVSERLLGRVMALFVCLRMLLWLTDICWWEGGAGGGEGGSRAGR
jgi:hypothetical protein